MEKKFLALACLVLIPCGAFAGNPSPSGAVLERHFSSDWAQAEPGSAAVPPAGQGSPVVSEDKPIQDMHSPVAHMHITVMGYRMYASQYEGGELARYMGISLVSQPGSESEDTVVAGSYDEDMPLKNPWNQLSSQMRHFWDCRAGSFKGLAGYDSAVNRAQKYLTGGFGLDGEYDRAWSENSGKRRGARGQGILGLYQLGEKGKAFWYLGHAAHLLEDMAVPAHILLYAHPFSGDAYEAYMKYHHQKWSQVPTEPIESFDALYDIFHRTADVARGFDAGHGTGLRGGLDGEKDQGARRAGGFSKEDIKQEGDVLMPLAYRRVAALYLYFFKQVDKTPPRVALDYQVQGLRAALRARAEDDQSGVDRRGYRFEYSMDAGTSWSAWKSVSPGPASSAVFFDLEPGRDYAFRVSAVDAVGNRAASPVRVFTAEPLGPAVAGAR